MKKLFIISLTFNILLIGFLIGKRIYYSNGPVEYDSYLNNYQYQEQEEIFPAYNRQADIAILGDSHAYKCHWDELLGVPVCNRGIGSDITQGMYARIGEVIRCRPKFCFVESGCNDVEKGISRDTTIKYFKLIITDLQKNNIKPVVMKIMHTSDSMVNKKQDSLNLKLQTLGVPTIGISVDPVDLQADGVHLKASGYLKWKDKILAFLKMG